MEKFREWWIDEPFDSVYRDEKDYEKCAAPNSVKVHVIDIRALRASEQANSELRGELERVSAELNQEIPFLEAYKEHFKSLLADRAQNAALKAAMTAHDKSRAKLILENSALKAEVSKLNDLIHDEDGYIASQKSLQSKLSRAIEALEYVQSVHIEKMMTAVRGEDVAQWALEHNAEHARQTLREINEGDGEIEIEIKNPSRSATIYKLEEE